MYVHQLILVILNFCFHVHYQMKTILEIESNSSINNQSQANSPKAASNANCTLQQTYYKHRDQRWILFYMFFVFFVMTVVIGLGYSCRKSFYKEQENSNNENIFNQQVFTGFETDPPKYESLKFGTISSV
jgi:hypothetical protein